MLHLPRPSRLTFLFLIFPFFASILSSLPPPFTSWNLLSPPRSSSVLFVSMVARDPSLPYSLFSSPSSLFRGFGRGLRANVVVGVWLAPRRVKCPHDPSLPTALRATSGASLMPYDHARRSPSPSCCKAEACLLDARPSTIASDGRAPL